MVSDRRGRVYPAFLVVAAALLAVAMVWMMGRHAQADGSYLIGVDMRPQSSGPSSEGAAETCVEVDKNDKFDVDVFVTNAEALTAWELRVDYDPDVVSLESADYNYLLTESGGGIFPQLFEQEQEGRYFLGAAEPKNPDSGTGVLARLHLKAVDKGSSPLTITSSPSAYRPRLTGAGGGSVGDFNGDGLWDGDVTGGTVKVDSNCAGSTPIKTPPPGHQTPRPTPTLKPGTTAAPTDAPGEGPGNTGGGEDGSEPTAPFVGNVGGSDDPGNANGGSNAGSEDGSGDGGSDTDPNKGEDGGTEGNRVPDAPSVDSDSSNSAVLVVIGGIIAAICIVLGAAFVLFRRGSPY